MFFLKKYFLQILLAAIIIFGFYFRFTGIEKGLSFWNDEDHTAIYAREIVLHGKPVLENETSTGAYQIALYYMTALSFKILGINEFSARLPSVLAGTFLIWLVYFIVNKLIDRKTALLAAFLVAFSQIQLAWSTQLRPYIWLEVLFTLFFYYSYKYINNKNNYFDKNIIYCFLISLAASLFHGVGIMLLGFFILTIITKGIVSKKYIYLWAILPIVLFLVVFLKLFFSPYLVSLFSFNTNTLHYRIFFTHNYLWLLIGALLSFLQFKRNYLLVVWLWIYAILIICISNFKLNSEYVRYCLPAFPFLYILFSIGIFNLYDSLSKHFKNPYLKYVFIIILTIVFFAFPFISKKIILIPQYYYSINADMRENPIVDYKTAFTKISTMIKGKDCLIMDAWNDRVPWYLPGQEYILLLSKAQTEKIDLVYGEKIYNTIPEVHTEIQNRKCGVVIVENWESLTSDDIKKYVKTNLKHQFDVNNLPYNENDKWSISIYSWGL